MNGVLRGYIKVSSGLLPSGVEATGELLFPDTFELLVAAGTSGLVATLPQCLLPLSRHLLLSVPVRSPSASHLMQ